MATALSTIHYVDDVIHITFSVEKITKDKKYKDQIKKEVIVAICALLNSDGGKVELRGEETKGNLVSTTILDSLTRALEQSLTSRLGTQITNSVKIIEEKRNNTIAIRVSKTRFLTTINYNLYRPTQKQVEIIRHVPDAFEIMKRRFVDQPVQFCSHQKSFLKNQDCNLVENEVIQFKHLKSNSAKRVTLADRMVGKSNKFSCYVSAFANHRGGHIYYGIDDNGVVRGEEILEISEIEKRVEKAIQKIIWPETVGRPKRGEDWEIFFEPVLDENSNPIPSTFVIVIFIAPCFGGVFTEEPESYEMVEGNIERMSFTTWKEKLQPVGLNKRKQEVPSKIKRVSLSPVAKKRCAEVNEVLTEAMNNGEWESFAERANYFVQKYHGKLEVKLMVFLRKLMANYRQGNKASNLLSENKKCFSRAGELFERFFHFSEKVVARVSGEAAESRDISTDALVIAEIMEPGLLTAAALLTAALIHDSRNDEGPSPEVLSLMALQHLQHVKDAPVARPDMIHIVNIILATYYLGFNLPGKVIKKVIDKESFQKAQASIMEVNRSICDGNPLMPYREIWFTLTQSMLYIRHAQFAPEKKNKHLKAALDYAKKAENLAKDFGLKEMVSWVQTLREHRSPLLKEPKQA